MIVSPMRTRDLVNLADTACREEGGFPLTTLALMSLLTYLCKILKKVGHKSKVFYVTPSGFCKNGKNDLNLKNSCCPRGGF